MNAMDKLIDLLRSKNKIVSVSKLKSKKKRFVT